MNALILLLAFAADPVASTSPRAIISGDETVIVGQMAEISAETSENAKSYRWLIRPKPLSMKYAAKDGSSLYISHDKPEIFEVELIVASPDGELDVQVGELEVKGSVAMSGVQGAEVAPVRSASPTVAELAIALSQLKELQSLLGPPAPQPIAMGGPVSPVSPQMSTLAMAGHPAPPSDGQIRFPDGVRILAGQVNSQTRSAEGKIAAGCFRSVANRIKVGTFSGADPWNEVQRACREALGNAYAQWQPFFVGLGQIVDGAKQQGLITNPQASVLLLESAAEVLGRLP